MTVTKINSSRNFRSYDVDGKYTVEVTLNHRMLIGEVAILVNGEKAPATHHAFRFQDFPDGTWSESKLKAFKWFMFAKTGDYKLDYAWGELRGRADAYQRKIDALQAEKDIIEIKLERVYDEASTPTDFTEADVLLEEDPKDISDDDGIEMTWQLVDQAKKMRGVTLGVHRVGLQGHGIATIYTKDSSFVLRHVSRAYVDWLYGKARSSLSEQESRWPLIRSVYADHLHQLPAESSEDQYRKSVHLTLPEPPKKRR